MTRRTLFQWHSWIGLTGGLLLFVICWSGTIAVFSRELDALADPLVTAPAAETVAWDQVYSRALERYPDWTISQVHAPMRPGYAVESWAEDQQGIRRRIYSDPATGEVIGATSYFNVQRFFRSLHMSLFIGELRIWGIPFGYLTVGLFSFVLLASGITSLLFYKRFWRGFFRLERRKGAKVFWSDLHKLTGLWSLWFLLLIASTGIWYLAEWKTPDGAPAPAAPGAQATAILPMGALVASAQRAYPDLQIRTLGTFELKEGLLEVQGQDGSILVRHRAAKAWINAYTGQLIAIQRPSRLTLYQRWIDTADPLHFGDFAGLASKAIWFLFGLALSGLALTGAYLQAKRQQRQRLPRHRSGIWTAYGATVAVLGMAAFYGFKEISGYGINGAMPPATSLQLAIIIGWLISTFAALTVWAWKVR